MDSILNEDADTQEQAATEEETADLAEPVAIDLNPDDDTLLDDAEWDAIAGDVAEPAVIKDAMKAIGNATDA
jgi:nitrate reductase beta subunit